MSHRQPEPLTAESARCEPCPGGSERPFDLLIIGAGSAGFAAAIRATELGASVGMVERGALGGTCVNVGCVPSKTLIRAAELRHRAAESAFDGVVTSVGPVDFGALIAQKRQLVADLQQAKYVDVLSAHPSVMLLQGEARLRSDGAVEVDGELVRARKVLINTGSRAQLAPIEGLAEAGPLSSTELMELERLPAHLVVLGGGYVGLELGQTMARLGARVTVLARSRLLSHEDPEISEALAGYLRAEGIDVQTGAHLERVSGGPGAFEVLWSRDGERRRLAAEQVLAATGRSPNSRGMGLEEIGVALGARGEIVVDEHLRTSRPNLYAAGDVTGEPAFVYVAAYAGRLAAEHAITGKAERYDVSVVPRVTFTDPAVASVGLSEAEARRRGFEVAIGRLSMSHLPRAIAARDTRGFVKLVVEASGRKLLGAHFLAPEAGDMIQAAAMAIRFDISTRDIASMLHPYLTRAEALKLACQSIDKDVAKLSCCAA